MEVAAFVLLIVAICLASLYVGFRGVAWLFGEISGWHKLESLFTGETDAPVWTRNGETVRVNSIRFRRCVNVGIQADALYLRVSSIFRYKPLRIPWDRMTMFQPDNIYGRPAMRFLAGGATIAVKSPLFAEMRPHLGKTQPAKR